MNAVLQSVGLLIGISWLAIFAYQLITGRQWNRRTAYLCFSTGLALVIFYFLHFEQTTAGHSGGPWQFPFGARLILVGAKVTLAFWTVLWVLRRKTIPAPA